eukprot:3426298-Rhodomonas_salina.2
MCSISRITIQSSRFVSPAQSTPDHLAYKGKPTRVNVNTLVSWRVQADGSFQTNLLRQRLQRVLLRALQVLPTQHKSSLSTFSREKTREYKNATSC